MTQRKQHPQQIAYLMTHFMITYATTIILASGTHGAKGFSCQKMKPTSILNGASGDDNVCSELTKHYKSLFQPNSHIADDHYKTETINLYISRDPSETASLLVDMQVVQNCMQQLNKAAGRDGICSEHTKYSGSYLSVHVCFLFNAMLRHSFE